MQRTIDDLATGPVTVAPLDAAEVLGYGKPGKLWPYDHLPTIKALEDRGIFDPGTCRENYRAQVVGIHGFWAEICTYDEPGGKPVLRSCAASPLRGCLARTDDLVMLYVGAKEGKRVVHFERIAPIFGSVRWF